MLVIEHNLDVIKCADWIIDPRSRGWRGGGKLLAEGTPEQVARRRVLHRPVSGSVSGAAWATPRSEALAAAGCGGGVTELAPADASRRRAALRSLLRDYLLVVRRCRQRSATTAGRRGSAPPPPRRGLARNGRLAPVDRVAHRAIPPSSCVWDQIGLAGGAAGGLFALSRGADAAGPWSWCLCWASWLGCWAMPCGVCCPT